MGGLSSWVPIIEALLKSMTKYTVFILFCVYEMVYLAHSCTTLNAEEQFCDKGVVINLCSTDNIHSFYSLIYGHKCFELTNVDGTT